MKVALVIERFAPGPGGVEGAVSRLAGELVERGVEVTVVCRGAESDPRPGLEILRVGAPRFWQPLRVTLFSRHAGRATRRGFDIVHSFARTRHQDIYRTGGGSHADYLERLYRAPRLQRLLPRHRAILRIEEAVFRDPRQIIQCVTDRCAREIRARYAISPERLLTIHNGVDAQRFHPGLRDPHRARIRHDLGLEGPVALFVGHGFRRKGLDRAIHGLAASGVRATLLVAGRGDAAPYRRLAARRGVAGQVRFLGPRRDVEALHAASDLFVLPTRYDPFANSVLEAMASGLPVATTPEAGIAEVIEHGTNGFVHDQDFSPAFSWLSHPEKLAPIGEAARRTAERFTWERHADAVMKLYARVRA